MSLHYNAFISYKHAELDNKIAAMVERGLEHYHIPHKIRKKTGMKKIERIFRDTDELPITSDLSGTIAEALKNADYLIVICSTNTCKSMWVEREIKLFLQNHTQDQILTVLADGEPVDVVPEILKNKEITRVNEQGIEETVTIPVEPLSCDFRLPAREAKNTELPRLAASLIGCSYNELMDRQRQYKMKRLTAIFAAIMAVMLTIAGNLIYSNKKVNDSYRASLISQSKYLANEVEKLLDNEQRIDALHLALYSLPSEEMPDRPVTTEAVKAITRATMAYLPRESSNITSMWNYEMPNTIESIDVSSEEKVFIAMDRSGIIKAWDTDTHNELFSYSVNERSTVPSSFKYISDGKLLIAGSRFVACFNVRTGEKIWETQFEGSYHTGGDIIITSDGDILLAMSQGTFGVYSAKDGKKLKEYKISAELLELLDFRSVKNIRLSPDNKKIGFAFYNAENHAGVGIYDIDSGETIYKLFDGDYICATLYPTDDAFFFAYNEDSMSSNSNFIDKMLTLSSDHVNILCLDPNDLSEKWTKDFSHNDISLGAKYIYLENNNSIAFYEGNVSDIWDASTGDLLHHYVLDSSVVGAFLNEGKPTPSYITTNGGIGNTTVVSSDKPDTIRIFNYFTDDLDDAVVSGGIYVRQHNSNRVIYYATMVSDKEWVQYENAPETDSLYYSFLDDNIAAVISKTDEGAVLNMYDPNTKKFISSTKLSEDSSEAYYYSMIGTYDGKLLYTHSNPQQKELVLGSIDYTTGECTTKVINNYESDHNITPIYANGKIVFVDQAYPGVFAVIYDVASGKSDKYRMPSDKLFYNRGLYYFEEQGYIYYAGTQDSGEQDYIVNIKENEITAVSLPEDWADTKCVSLNDDGTLFAATDEHSIIIKEVASDNIVADIPINDVKTHRLFFFNEKGTELLIVPSTDGYLYRYDALSGKLIGKTSYSTTSMNYYSSKVTFDHEHSCIYLNYSSITNIIDMESFLELGYITGSMGYHVPSDSFPTISKDDDDIYHLGYFRRYNLDDLIKKAKDILQDHEMPKEQKDAYGIN